MEDESLISVVDEGITKHLFFHGTIDKSSAFNLSASLYSIKADLLLKSQPASFQGFTVEEETKTGTIIEDDIDEPKIILHLNCPGGTVSGAFIIADTIQNLGIDVNCIVEGAVASAGVLILLACDKRYMLPHAQIYLHETIHAADGLGHNDLKRFMSDANEINDKLKQYYVERTGLTRQKINKMFKDEVTLDFTEASKLGFINQALPVNTR